MTAEECYKEAKSRYAGIAVDTDRALDILKEIPVSMHCWQGDDVAGFGYDGPLTGGIQTTGNYPGRARTPEELMEDIDKVLALAPGRTKLNLHASYAVLRMECRWTETGCSHGILKGGSSLPGREDWE